MRGGGAMEGMNWDGVDKEKFNEGGMTEVNVSNTYASLNDFVFLKKSASIQAFINSLMPSQ